jgi:hypothetical protein
MTVEYVPPAKVPGELEVPVHVAGAGVAAEATGACAAKPSGRTRDATPATKAVKRRALRTLVVEQSLIRL